VYSKLNFKKWLLIFGFVKPGPIAKLALLPKLKVKFKEDLTVGFLPDRKSIRILAKG